MVSADCRLVPISAAWSLSLLFSACQQASHQQQQSRKGVLGGGLVTCTTSGGSPWLTVAAARWVSLAGQAKQAFSAEKLEAGGIWRTC